MDYKVESVKITAASSLTMSTVTMRKGLTNMPTISTFPSNHPFARGHSSVFHVTDPEGWVRGRASLDTGTGDLTMVLGLETDSVTEGVKGRLKVRRFDSSGIEIAVIKMNQDIGIPGKAPGRARIEEFTLAKRIPADVASRTTGIDVEVEFTGKQFGLFGISLDVVIDAISILIAVL
jgi:hypothetical protein